MQNVSSFTWSEHYFSMQDIPFLSLYKYHTRNPSASKGFRPLAPAGRGASQATCDPLCKSKKELI